MLACQPVVFGEQVDGRLVPAQYLVELRPAAAAAGEPATALGRLDAAHLADHPAAEAALADTVVAGSDLGTLLVLERLEVRLVEASWKELGAGPMLCVEAL